VVVVARRLDSVSPGKWQRNCLYVLRRAARRHGLGWCSKPKKGKQAKGPRVCLFAHFSIVLCSKPFS
jgi:hypothetical protein